MSEHLVPIKKETGGCTVTVNDHTYEWGKDGSVTEVPYTDAVALLAIRDGGFSEADEKAAEKAREAAEAEAATQAPDEPPRDAPVPNVGLEARAPEGLALPDAPEQLPARPYARRAASNSAKMGSGPADTNVTPRPRGGTAKAPAAGKK